MLFAAALALLALPAAAGADLLTTARAQEWRDQPGMGLTGFYWPGDHFGQAVAAGDFDGDGYDDLAIGDREGSVIVNAGAVHVLYSDAGGLHSVGDQLFTDFEPSTGAPDRQAEDDFGRTLAAGDFNGDSFDDLAIGIPGEFYGIAGNVITMVGSPVGLLPGLSTLWTEELRGHPNHPVNDERYGFALASGDFDGNEIPDLAVGAISEDGVDGGGNPVADGGIVFALHGALFADDFESGDLAAWSDTTPLAAPPQAAETDPGVNLTDDAAPQTLPSVSGHRVVWQDYRDGPPAIVLLDLENGQRTQVTPPGTSNGPPAIDGDRIVYARWTPDQWQLLAYDVRTGVETQFAKEDIEIGLGRFSLSGDRVVWHTRRGGNWDVYLYDFAKQVEKRITFDPADQADPAIEGDLIAWADRRHGGVWWDLYTYDVRTETAERITQETTLGRGPAISAGRIAWGDVRGGYFGLYEYDVAGATESGPHATTPIENGLALSGDYAAWYDASHDVFVYDLRAAAERRVTQLPERQWFPSLSGLDLVWQDERGGEEEIYFASIPELFE